MPNADLSLARTAFLSLLLVAVLGLWGCSLGERKERDASSGARGTDDSPWNVVLVVVDTLRADHLHSYGYERATSPNLDRFAQGAVRFENAYAQAGCTFPSVNSILTSRYPQHFSGRRNPGPEGPGRRQKDWSIPPEMQTLPELLQSDGYATAAISASLIVRATPSSRNPTGGYDAGFDHFDEACEMQSAACVRERAAVWLKSLPKERRPFFLYLHYMEPHNPYRPPPEHIRRFATGPARHRFVAEGEIFPLVSWLYRDGPEVAMGPAEWQALTDRYDEEIRYFDDEWPRLLELLDLDRTLVILASDHGEELFDHGEVSHCRSLVWDTILRTPLLVWAPNLPTSGPHQALAQNLDIAPTIVDLLQLQGTTAFEGKSLMPALEADSDEVTTVQRFAFAAQGTSRAVIGPPWKLHLELKEQRFALYNLESDPGEQTDLLESHPEQVARLREVLFRWIEDMEGEVGARESLEGASEAEKRLKALGYF